jgi:hypothetical protein
VGLFIGGAFLPSASSLSSGLFIGVFALIFFSAGGLIFYRSIRNYFAERRLGEVDVNLESAEATPGEQLRCRTTIAPLVTINLNEITVSLHGYEEVVSGGGTNQTTNTRATHYEDVPIQQSKQATVHGGRRTFKTNVTIPDSAPYSFYADDNQMRWDVELHVDVPNWPDWVHTELLTVRPESR